MRIRRKKHLDERLKNASDILIVPDMDIVNVNIAVQNKKLYDFNKLFGNDNPIDLEIGCGKGGFITQKALLEQNTNFVAVEMLENMIWKGIDFNIKIPEKNINIWKNQFRK